MKRSNSAVSGPNLIGLQARLCLVGRNPRLEILIPGLKRGAFSALLVRIFPTLTNCMRVSLVTYVYGREGWVRVEAWDGVVVVEQVLVDLEGQAGGRGDVEDAGDQIERHFLKNV